MIRSFFFLSLYIIVQLYAKKKKKITNIIQNRIPKMHAPFVVSMWRRHQELSVNHVLVKFTVYTLLKY
jgi:hypothetical protein